MRWTNPQRAVFDSPYRLTISWGGNGVGKSLMLAEYVRRAMGGELPWQLPNRDGHTVILAGNTWSQLGSTIKYLWSLTDPRWFRETIRYEAGGLKGQRLQVYDIVAGPGEGGELRLGTFKAENLAGPRAEVVATDEPLPEEVYNELWPRLFGRGGRMLQTFTPTMGTAGDMAYIWRMVDDDALPWAGEIRMPLDADAVTPRGGMYEIPWATQEEIDQFEAGLSIVQREMRMGRSRHPKTDAAYYSAWGDHLVMDRPPPWFYEELDAAHRERRKGRIRVGVGVDHGSKPGAQRAVLVNVMGFGLHAKVWVADEYEAGGTTSRQDAAGLIAMLERNHLAPKDVDLWVGDRAHDWRGGKKANQYLMQGIAAVLGYDVNRRGWVSKLPRQLQMMRTPRKSLSSVYEGADIIHRMMLRGRDTYAVNRRCVKLDEDHRQWRGGHREPAKDGCDAERYVIIPMIEGLDR